MAIAPILARHFLSPKGSGYFAAANQAAQMALFVPGAVAMVAFPRFASSSGRGPEARRLLLQALAVVGLLGGVAAVVLVVAPGLVIDILFGSGYLPASSAMRILAVAGWATALINLLVYFHLGRRSLMSVASWPALVLLFVLVLVFHGGLLAISAVVLGVTSAAMVALLIGAGFCDTRKASSDLAKKYGARG